MSEQTENNNPNDFQQPQQPNQPQSFGNAFHPGGYQFNMQQPLPNATAVLVLGILSIVTCCCYGVFGSVLALIALILANRDRKLYAQNFSFYTESSYKNLNAGRVCAIIGLILSVLIIIYFAVVISIFGLEVLKDPDRLREALESYQQRT